MQPVRDCLSTVILACWATVDLSWSIKQWKWCVGTAVNFWRYRQEMVHRLHPESWHVRKKPPPPPPPLGFVWQLHTWLTVLDLSGSCTCGSLSGKPESSLGGQVVLEMQCSFFGEMPLSHLTLRIKNQRAIRGFDWAIERQCFSWTQTHSWRTLDRKQEAKYTKQERFASKKIHAVT